MALNRSNFIRNFIILFDFVIVNAVLLSLYYYNLKYNPSRLAGVTLSSLLLYVNGAMGIAQLFFSNIVHGHYQAIDKVLRQVSLLSLLFAISFPCLMETCKLFLGMVSPNAHFTLLCVGMMVVALIICRMLEYMLLRKLRNFGRNSRTIIFVGHAPLIVEAYDDINLQSHAGLRVLGYYSDEQIPEDSHVKMPYLGTLAELDEKITTSERRFTDDIYCTDIPGGTEFITQIVDFSIRNGIQFNYVPLFVTEFGYMLKPRIEGEQVVFSNLNEPLQSFGNRFIKRSFDIFCSGCAILVIAPFVPIIGLIIKISSPGPIFFKQKRTGLNGKDFNMLKFRSMHVNKDADTKQATRDDPRKFAFGNFMRKTNIDELPQVFNVFLGDMSIVGPRPHMLAHTTEYRKKIYEYMLRHLVRPGITGWAQVTGYRGETPELWQMEGRVQRDLWYIQNWSFWLDIRIIFRTALLTIKRDKNAF